MDLPVYTIVVYPVSELKNTGICIKKYVKKKYSGLKRKLTVGFRSRTRCVGLGGLCPLPSFVFFFPPAPKPLFDMPESLPVVMARVVRELRERQCKRTRELRPERDNLIRETVEEVRVRVSAEQRLRTEKRVTHWNKVDNWLAGDISRVWLVRLSENLLLGHSFGEVNWDQYIFLLVLSPVHNRYPRLGLRSYICLWKKEWGKWDVEDEERRRIGGPH